MHKKDTLPKVIIFYGPPGSGKNTQAELLIKKYPEYTIVDYGSELRHFVETDRTKFGDKIREQISTGSLVEVDDLMTIISNKLMRLVDTGKSVILIGPGRSKDDTRWLAKHLSKLGISSCVFHLHLALEDIINRISQRYFIPGSETPYPSYQEALAASPDGAEPFRREDDANTDRVVKRYRTQYKHKFSSILFLFQLLAESMVFSIDGAQSIDEVQKDIQQILDCYYLP
jgi:adenylate kinase